MAWEPIVKGQAEITGMPAEVLEVFSKRAAQVSAALEVKVEDFRDREGRDPTRWEKAAMTREAAADTRAKKTGHDITDLRAQWIGEAAEIGWTPEKLINEITAIGRQQSTTRNGMTIEEVIDRLSASGSTWTPADVLGAICDLATVEPSMPGDRWGAALDRASQQVAGACEDIDPSGDDGGQRRESDGRSVWLEPTAPHLTSTAILAQEEHILTWAMNAQADDPNPSTTINRDGLDVMQADAAAAVAGSDWLVVVVGPAGTGKTTMLSRAVEDLRVQGRAVFGVAPTAKAARVLAAETGIGADTVAKLLHEWARTDRPPDPQYRLPGGATVIIDEAGIIGTASLHQLVGLAQDHDWRLVLVGDPRQLQAVGRGGMFNELCGTSRAFELARIHRFHQPWEAAASLQLRAGNPMALDAYEAHDRIVVGPFEDHLARIAGQWMQHTAAGKTVAVTAATNDHVNAINHAVQRARFISGQLSDRSAAIAGGEYAYVGDVIATRRNDRRIHTTTGEPVLNRDLWIVTAVYNGGDLTVAHHGGHGTAQLPAGYAAEHVRLGYAATEHGNQADTVDIGIDLVSGATTHRGLYVGMTRGRDTNQLLVITDTADITEARDVIEGVLAHDRSDLPAVSQRRDLAQQLPPVAPPAVERAPQPRLAVPDWFGTWRTGLEHRQQELVEQITGRADQRTQAAADLVALQPLLGAARAAWWPYQQPIDQLENELRNVLRPAMWKANTEAREARFGRRHSAARAATEASRRVTNTQARIDAIEAEGQAVKDRLDAIRTKAQTLDNIAHPSEVLSHFEDYDQRLLDIFDHQLNAADTYLALAHGQPVNAAELTHAIGELSDIAQRAPYHPLHPTQIGRTEWAELLEPVTQLLRTHGIELDVGEHLERRGPDLGLGL
ncbi:MAG: AAA family ATPase [Actinomycetota bacterium]|nr:AAA family ATPase [Actinomycetota bacterium]